MGFFVIFFVCGWVGLFVLSWLVGLLRLVVLGGFFPLRVGQCCVSDQGSDHFSVGRGKLKLERGPRAGGEG